MNGSETYVTGGMKANLFTAGVRTGVNGAAGVSALHIPAGVNGVSRSGLYRKREWWCSDTVTIDFENLKVCVENLLGVENQGFKVIMNTCNSERMAKSGPMNGFAKVCFDEAVAWAKQRKIFGKRLADNQVVRRKNNALDTDNWWLSSCGLTSNTVWQ
jgi:acyl-CoA dehydrogenase